MKTPATVRLWPLAACLTVVVFVNLTSLPSFSAGAADTDPGSIPTADLIQPAELAKILQSSARDRPIIIQVGSRVLFEEAHIPGAEYVGPASSAEGREKLRQRLQSVSRQKMVVLYCGCCPWSHCPNIKPAWDIVRALSFSRAKVLYIANNFGADWIDKGYPAAKAQ